MEKSMPWIESHSTLIEHKKVRDVAKELNISPVLVIGHLHCLWHKVLELREDGDISSWTVDDIAYYSKWEKEPKIYYEALKNKFIDEQNNMKIIHNWLDYAWRYLYARYHQRNEKLLTEIKRKYMRQRMRQPLRQRTNLPNLPNLPNLTIPTIEGEEFEKFMQKIKNDWNRTAKELNLAIITIINSDRKKALKQRFGNKDFMEHWEKVLTKIGVQSFLLGNNDRKWRIDFDYFIGLANRKDQSLRDNYIKILEGKFKKEEYKSQALRRLEKELKHE